MGGPLGGFGWGVKLGGRPAALHGSADGSRSNRARQRKAPFGSPNATGPNSQQGRGGRITIHPLHSPANGQVSHLTSRAYQKT